MTCGTTSAGATGLQGGPLDRPFPMPREELLGVSAIAPRHIRGVRTDGVEHLGRRPVLIREGHRMGQVVGVLMEGGVRHGRGPVGPPVHPRLLGRRVVRPRVDRQAVAVPFLLHPRPVRLGERDQRQDVQRHSAGDMGAPFLRPVEHLARHAVLVREHVGEQLVVRLPVPRVAFLDLLPHAVHRLPPLPVAWRGVEAQQGEHDDIRRRIGRQGVTGGMAGLPGLFHLRAAALPPWAGHRAQRQNGGEESQGVRRAGFGLGPGVGEGEPGPRAGEHLEAEDPAVPVGAGRGQQFTCAFPPAHRGVLHHRAQPGVVPRRMPVEGRLTSHGCPADVLSGVGNSSSPCAGRCARG